MNHKNPFFFALALASLCSSSALADTFGLRLGFPLGVQYTAENNFGRNRDLRVSGAILPLGVAFLGSIQGDLLVSNPLGDSRTVSLFYGGGAHLSFIAASDGGLFGPGVQGTLGVDFQLDRSISLFLDTSVGASYFFGATGVGGFNLGFLPYVSGALGLNFKL